MWFCYFSWFLHLNANFIMILTQLLFSWFYEAACVMICCSIHFILLLFFLSLSPHHGTDELDLTLAASPVNARAVSPSFRMLFHFIVTIHLINCSILIICYGMLDVYISFLPFISLFVPNTTGHIFGLDTTVQCSVLRNIYFSFYYRI